MLLRVKISVPKLKKVILIRTVWVTKYDETHENRWMTGFTLTWNTTSKGLKRSQLQNRTRANLIAVTFHSMRINFIHLFWDFFSNYTLETRKSFNCFKRKRLASRYHSTQYTYKVLCHDLSDLCDVKMTERPSLMMSRIRFHKKRRACGSIPVVGSSLSDKWQRAVNDTTLVSD